MPLMPAEYRFLDAATEGNLPHIKDAIKSGINIDVRDDRGEPWETTALMHASEHGHTDVVRVLLGAGANVKLKDRDVPGESGEGANTALHYAVENGHVEITKLLLAANSGINVMSKRGTPLIVGINSHQLNTTAVLLEAGADVNLHDRSTGCSPLHNAILAKVYSVVPRLIKSGADVNAKDKTGTPPLFFAIHNKSSATIDLLLERGAEINAVDDDGFTALMWAVVRNLPGLVTRLVNEGANLNVVENDEGLTALDLSRRDEHKEVEEILIAAGAKTAAQLRKSTKRLSRKD